MRTGRDHESPKPAPRSPGCRSAAALRRLLPLLVVAGVAVAFVALRLDRYLTVETLRNNDVELHAFIAAHLLLSTALFITAYALVVGFSLPGGAVMTLSGGFLFGFWTGSLLSIIGATAGAVMVFLIARLAIGDILRARAGPLVARMAAGFERNAFSYLLFLRLVPLFPFWAVNLAPALLGMDIRSFVAATVIGIIPATLAYASVGDGLGLYFKAGSQVPVSEILSPEMIALRVGLALLALLPMVIRWVKRRPHP